MNVCVFHDEEYMNVCVFHDEEYMNVGVFQINVAPPYPILP